MLLRILEKLRLRCSPPAPAHAPRRVKGYAAQTGIHYEYQLQSSECGRYVFSIWTEGQPGRSVEISVPLEQLKSRDRYALAKLELFRMLDECGPADLPEFLEVTDPALLNDLLTS
ncbi:MAG: hypothetical protein M3Z09_06760 [Acidobacteriota bacterium]|nr:hypothetical protein [Acidobacteriota bacterium]